MYRRISTAVALLALIAVSAGFSEGFSDREAHVTHQQIAQANPTEIFSEWVARFNKAYAGDVEEYAHRFTVWMDNLNFIVEYNSKLTSHWLGLNKFADWSHDEFKRHSLGYRPNLRKNSNRLVGAQPFKYAATVPPSSIDWREKNAVTAVKNQQQCGSCWAFSTTGSVEGVNALYTGNLTTLSEQELVDCDSIQDHGCSGGLMDFAYDFIIENGGIDTEEDYPYIAADGVCAKRKLHRHVVTIDGYEDVPADDENALLKAVANQPISVAIEADEREFQLYAGGVFDAPCGTALDHGVLIVGYGSEPNVNGTVQPYWIIKNSWGAEWGDSGYIKLVRGLTDAPQGQCGVAMQASFPTKSKPNPPPSPPSPPEPPAPPGPKPVVCDETTTCPDGSTCCCLRDFFGYCFTWACCPLPEATCCEDLTHCCPKDLPVCDTDAGRCTKGEGMSFEESVPWSTKVPATRTTWGRDWIQRIPDAVPEWAQTGINRIEMLLKNKEDAGSDKEESSQQASVSES